MSEIFINTLTSLPMLPLHFACLIFSFVWIIISDYNGLMWIVGKKETLSLKNLEKYHKYVWFGLLGLIISGVLLLLEKDYLLEDFVFKFKMFFVLVLFVNSFFIGKKMLIASQFSFKDISNKDKVILLASGAVSTMSWISAFVLAKFL
jgi:uncharacterized membrane protein